MTPDQIKPLSLQPGLSPRVISEGMISRCALVLWLVSTTLAVLLQVDLGYSIYQGVANSTTGLTTFKGCADPPPHQIIKGF
jgi:hypothetical protein